MENDKFMAYIRDLVRDYRKVKPLMEELKQLNFPANGESGRIHDIGYMHQWENKPIVISLWDATLEWTHKILRVIREKYGCFWNQQEWSSVRKIVFTTRINSIYVYVQMVTQKECKWIPTGEVTEEVQMDCS